MAATAETKTKLTSIDSLSDGFPKQQIADRLRPLLQQIADDSALLLDDWNPLLDSLSVVSVIISLEDLFEFELPPERIVRKGGYKNLDDAIDHMTRKLEEFWKSNAEKKGNK